MARWTTAFPSYNTLYSYVQVDNWEVHGDRCTFDLSGGITSPYYWNVNGISCEIGWWESGTYRTIDTDTASYNRNGGDVVVFDFSDYFMRQAADRTVYLYHEGQASGTAYAESSAYTVPHLAPSVNWAASNPVVRNSDNSITLTWDAPALEYSAMCLEVSTDGGAWSQFAVLWNTATSYTWTGCSADHSYKFRIRTNYLASYSDYDICATVIYNTPAAPQSITTSAAGGTSVTVDLVNTSPVANKLQYQVSNDDGATWGAVQDSASLTSFTVTITGTGKVRARNAYDGVTPALVSDWIVTGTIITICPPAKPSINSPQSGDTWDISKPLVVSWLHNSLDGSAQTAAKITLVKAGTPPVSHTETLDPFTGSTYSIDFATAQSWITGLAVGDVLNVAVKTKGADASYSSNTVVNGITALTAPTLSITKPAATVTGMPIEFEATYSDMTGYTCQAATVSLTKDGRTLFSEPATIDGTTITAQLDTSEFLPANGETYTVVLTARSSSSLQATANATFTTAFVPPKAATLQITNDADTGYASLLVEGAPSKTAEGEAAPFEWNQLYQCPRSGSYTENGITRVYGSANDLTFSGTPTAYGNWYINSSTWPMTFYAGHKYLLQIIPSGTPNDYVQLRFTSSSTYFSNGARIVEPSSTTSTAGVLRIWIDTHADLTDGYTVAISVYDLTAIFGSGNEPTTVEAFRATPQYQAMQSLGKLYAYDSGSTQHYPLPLDTTEGDYLQDVTIEGAAVRVVAPTDSYTGDTNTQYDSEPNVVRSLTVEGKSAKWNQYGDVGMTHRTRTARLTVTGSGGATTCTVNATSSNLKFVEYEVTKGHKFFIGFHLVTYGYGISIGVYKPNAADYSQRENISGTVDQDCEYILTTNDTYYGIRPVNFATGAPVDTYCTVTNFMLVDLTAIFGSGNEPATVDAFKATDVYKVKLAAGELYAYDAGSLVSIEGVGVRGRNLLNRATEITGHYINSSGVVSSDANSSYSELIPVVAEQQYTLKLTASYTSNWNRRIVGYSADGTFNQIVATANSKGSVVITGTIPYGVTGVRLSYRTDDADMMFSQGSAPTDYEPFTGATITAPLRSAGSIHDTLMLDKDEWTVRRNVGAVDLGTLEWTVSGHTFRATLDGIRIAANNAEIIPMLCIRYTPNTPANVATSTAADMCIASNNGVETGQIMVRDSQYDGQTGAAFKTAMSGVYLFYELATPTADAQTAITPIELGTAFTIGTELDSSFAMTADDGTDPYVLTTTGIGTVSGGTITHQALNLATNAHTYADVLDGAWLAGIGEVKDVAHVGESAAIERRIGCIDLGTLSWVYTSGENSRMTSAAAIDNIKVPLSGVVPAAVLCSKFEADSTNNIYAHVKDYTIGVHVVQRTLWVYASDFTNAAAFKTAMSGVLLYYELATPTTETLDPVTFDPLEVPDSVTVGAYTPSEYTVTYGDGLTDYESVSVSRINPDGTMTPLLTDGQNGAGIVDKYAPLNTAYEYAVTSKSSAGAINTTLVENLLRTDRWFAYWTHKDGETSTEEIASAKWNPANSGIKLARPQRQRVFFAGRSDPVSFDGPAVNLTESPSWLQVEKEDADKFVQLIQDGGRGVYKSCDGWVYHADFELTLNPAYISVGYYGGMTLNITRIAGSRL